MTQSFPAGFSIKVTISAVPDSHLGGQLRFLPNQHVRSSMPYAGVLWMAGVGDLNT